jgi:hypothetical protein
LNSLIEIIKEWPIIIQGALGSGLFWLLLTLLQKLSSTLTNRISHLSKKSELEELRTELLHLQMDETHGMEKLHFAAPLLFRASRPFFRAMLWLVLGLALSSVFSLFGVIGYVGSIYYLLKALNVVSKLQVEGEAKEYKSTVKIRIAELDNDS